VLPDTPGNTKEYNYRTYPLDYKTVKDTEHDLVAGEHEVRIKMYQNRSRTYMGTGFSSSLENWNSKTRYPESTHPKFEALTARINKLTEDISFEIKAEEKVGRIITPIQIKVMLTNRFKTSTPVDKRPFNGTGIHGL